MFLEVDGDITMRPSCVLFLICADIEAKSVRPSPLFYAARNYTKTRCMLLFKSLILNDRIDTDVLI